MKRAKRLEAQRRKSIPERPAPQMYWFDTTSESERLVWQAGREVVVTTVCRDPEGAGYKWPDKQFVGEVTRAIRETPTK